MNTEKILKLLKECIQLLEIFLVGTDQKKVGHAFEFILIILDERINEIINEVQKSLISNKELLGKFLKSQEIEFEQEKLEADDNYCIRPFRTAFNKTKLGQGLMLLHSLRDNIKHEFIHFTEEDHVKFAF